MVYIQDHPISLVEGNTIKQGRATSFYGQHGYAVLQKAQEYGEVLTLPEFLQALYLSSFQSSLLEIPFTVQTEEIIGKSKAGNSVAIVVHGAGILTPKRIRNGSILEEVEDEVPNHGLTRTKSGRGQFALPLYDYEVHDLLDGHILPVFSYADFEKSISDLPREYALVRDFRPETEFPTERYFAKDYYPLAALKIIPRVISLAGGGENIEHCFDLLNLHCGLQEMRYSHPFQDLGPEQPQGRFIQVHGIHNLFYSHMEMEGSARFLAVKRENLEEKIDKVITIEV